MKQMLAYQQLTTPSDILQFKRVGTAHPDEILTTERLSPHVDREAFMRELMSLQVPCPWGDLSEREEILDEDDCLSFASWLHYAPLGLVLGAGNWGQHIDLNAYTVDSGCLSSL